MQIDRWPTHIEQEYEDLADEAPAHPLRSRASVWVDPVVRRTISASTNSIKEQRVIPNPQTPIPARASAHPIAPHVKVQPRYTSKISLQSDITRIPTTPPAPTIWQYKSPNFEGESSISSRSLAQDEATAIDTLDTVPPPRPLAVDELDTIPPSLSPAIDELDTMPPSLSPAIDELNTQPPRKKNTFVVQKSSVLFGQNEMKRSLGIQPLSPSLARSFRDDVPTLVPERVTHEQVQRRPLVTSVSPVAGNTARRDVEEGIPWTTAQGKDSWLAQRIAAKDSKKRRKSSPSLNPVERLRWWLLYPGRIEFLLWLSGTIVLVAITFLLLFATTLSVGWLNIGSMTGTRASNTQQHHQNTSSLRQTPCAASNAKQSQCHATSVSGLQLTLVDNSVLLANTPIHLRGQGFSAAGTVVFTYDAQLPCRPNITQTDAQGTFSLLLLLGANVQAGAHQITALDMASKHTVKVTVTIDNAQTSKNGTLPYGQHSSSVTQPNPTGAGGSQGGASKPVSQTPVPVVPTVAASPTSVPTQPPTPTVSVSPSPTALVSPTADTTTAQQPTNPSLALQNAFYTESADGHFLMSLWFWVAIIGYMLSMMMLGLAGLLYHRKRRQSSP